MNTGAVSPFVEHHSTRRAGYGREGLMRAHWVKLASSFSVAEFPTAAIFVVDAVDSRFWFVKAYPDASMTSWLQGHIDFMRAVGGVPRMFASVYSEASVVEGSARVISPEYAALASQYGFRAMSSPTEDDPVNAFSALEREVNEVLRPLLDRQFGDLAEFNAAIAPLVRAWNQKVHNPQRLAASPEQLFNEAKADTLGRLPNSGARVRPA